MLNSTSSPCDSKEACMLECNIDYAAKSCGCTPWNYPRLSNTPMCDVFGFYCFKKVLRSPTIHFGCKCLDRCDGIFYSFYASAKELPKDQMCNIKTNMKVTDLMYSFYQENALPKKFLAWYNYIDHNETYKERDLCKKYLDYRAIVNFQLATLNTLIC